MTTKEGAEIRIIDRGTGEAIDACNGPDPEGRCPRVEEGRAVACAGQHLQALRGTTLDGWKFEVPGDLDVCPVVWLMRTF